MPWPSNIKNLAYKLDPECWQSYSGKSKAYKQAMEARRIKSLQLADNIDRKNGRPYNKHGRWPRLQQESTNMIKKHLTPLHMKIFMHYATGPVYDYGYELHAGGLSYFITAHGNSPAVRAYRLDLVEMGLMSWNSDNVIESWNDPNRPARCELTKAGKTFFHTLIATPVPQIDTSRDDIKEFAAQLTNFTHKFEELLKSFEVLCEKHKITTS
jgi:hypothetical protein